MARLLRSQPKISQVRRPIVVGPGLQYPPLRIKLASREAPIQARTRRLPHSHWQRPNVIGPGLQYPPLREKLVTQPPRFQHARSFRQPANLIGPITAPIRSKLVSQPRRYQHARSFELPVNIVGPVPTFALRAKLVSQPRRYQHARSFQLPVYAPPIVTTALLTQQLQLSTHVVRRHQAFSRTRNVEMVVISQPPLQQPVLQTPLVYGRRKTAPYNRLPVIVNPFVPPPPLTGPPATTILQIHLANQAATGARRLKVYSILRAPTVVGPFVPPPTGPIGTLQIKLVKRPYLAQRCVPAKFYPAIVNPATIFSGPDITRVRQPARYQHTIYRINKPTVTGAVVVPFFPSPMATHTTRVRRPLPPTHTILRKPVIVGAAVTFSGPDINFARISMRDRLRRAPHYKLSPPTVVGAFVPPPPPPTPPQKFSPFIDGIGPTYDFYNPKFATTPMRDSLRRRR